MDPAHSPFASARARHALQLAGLPSDAPIEMATSTRNEVVLCGDYVVRVNREPNQRLRREAHWCEYLPHRYWTPRIESYGGEVGSDYLIVARRPGQPLSRSWPLMNAAQRRRAIAQLADIMMELHRTPAPSEVADLQRTTHLVSVNDLSPLVPSLMAIEKLKATSTVDPGILRDTENTINGLAPAMSDYNDHTMVHGDLTFENVLWDGSNVTTVIDWEWSRGAPPDLDLDIILRFCGWPYAHVPEQFEAVTRPEDFADVPTWLWQDYPELFSHPRLLDRLRLYSIAFDLNELKDAPPARRRHELGPLHPLNRLAGVLGGGGHLAAWLSSEWLTTAPVAP